jgi:hypothetical protein
MIGRNEERPEGTDAIGAAVGCYTNNPESAGYGLTLGLLALIRFQARLERAYPINFS